MNINSDLHIQKICQVRYYKNNETTKIYCAKCKKYIYTTN